MGILCLLGLSQRLCVVFIDVDGIVLVEQVFINWTEVVGCKGVLCVTQQNK